MLVITYCYYTVTAKTFIDSSRDLFYVSQIFGTDFSVESRWSCLAASPGINPEAIWSATVRTLTQNRVRGRVWGIAWKTYMRTVTGNGCYLPFITQTSVDSNNEI